MFRYNTFLCTTYQRLWAELTLEETENLFHQMWFSNREGECGWVWLSAQAPGIHSCREHCSCTEQSESFLSGGPEVTRLTLQAYTQKEELNITIDVTGLDLFKIHDKNPNWGELFWTSSLDGI